MEGILSRQGGSFLAGGDAFQANPHTLVENAFKTFLRGVEKTKLKCLGKPPSPTTDRHRQPRNDLQASLQNEELEQVTRQITSILDKLGENERADRSSLLLELTELEQKKKHT